MTIATDQVVSDASAEWPREPGSVVGNGRLPILVGVLAVLIAWNALIVFGHPSFIGVTKLIYGDLVGKTLFEDSHYNR